MWPLSSSTAKTLRHPVLCFHPRQVIVKKKKKVSIEQCLGIKGSLNYLTHTFCSTSLSCPLPYWALWELWVQTFKFGVGDVRRSHLLSPPWETRDSFGPAEKEKGGTAAGNGCQGPGRLMAFAELSPSPSMSSPLANFVPMC